MSSISAPSVTARQGRPSGDAPPNRAAILGTVRLAALAFAMTTFTSIFFLALSAHEVPGLADPEALMEAIVDDEGSVGLLTLPGTARHPHQTMPAVVLLNDAAGMDQRSFRYAEQLRHAGFAVLDVELYVLSMDGAGPPAAFDRAHEAARLGRALRALRRHPDVDFTAFAAIGFGRGAHAVALASSANDDTRDLVARVLLYPGCGSLGAALREAGEGSPAPSGPVLIVHGGDDGANTQTDCETLAARLAVTGSEARVIRYRGAGYGWDIPSAGDGTTLLEGPDGQRTRAMGWPELAEMSAAQAAAFIAAALARASR
ncbi:hypothetical protein GWK15_16325 [Roseomonas oryzicola]|uniref:Dienelactone hydrolase domain-containing protein n=2 Tax=Neoroseomonas oryzicola TaxID=535904 RepID=A0ABX1EL40_9PROT|nr:hypothetical protein [Neoroseomonas oryzicola]